MAVGQNQWYHFGVGAPPILVYFSWDWDVHWEFGMLTHGQIAHSRHKSFKLTNGGVPIPKAHVGAWFQCMIPALGPCSGQDARLHSGPRHWDSLHSAGGTWQGGAKLSFSKGSDNMPNLPARICKVCCYAFPCTVWGGLGLVPQTWCP